MISPRGSEGKHVGLVVNVPGLGPVRLVQALAQNPETTLYQTDHSGVVVKVFDLSCGRPDEIGYGPYLNFQSELANFDEIHRLEGLRPYVPAYYGANADYEAKYAFIAMEYLQGQNLRSWAEEAAERGYGPEALDDLRRATHDVFAILDYFHRHDLLMIDFKPDNVIRLDDGTVKLVDLGAFFTTRHRSDVGKFVYAATPDHAEVLIDASNLQAGVPLTVASDIFSAGVALFEMATGDSRLALDPHTADEMLGLPSVYLFRDSQIADVWKAFPHLREALPQVKTQLKERRLLFSEVWHLLKSYLAVRVAEWESLAPAQQDQILMSTGTTFILEQLPSPLAWMAGAIARATVLRSLRVRDLPALVQLLGNPAPDHALADVAEHNCLVKHLQDLGLEADFASRLNTWEVRRDRQSGHFAIAAPLAARELADNARFVYLRQDHVDQEGQTYWHAVDEAEADVSNGTRANLAQLRYNHDAWVGVVRVNSRS
jgi:serine/threonine protein kinase